MGQLETALASTEADARAALKAADFALRNLKRLVASATSGDIAALERGISESDSAIQALREQFRNTLEGWTFETQAYAESGGLSDELVATATAGGLDVHEQDGRIFSYPVLVRVLPGERAVLLDKVKLRQIRPSVVVARLARLKNQPSRFRPEAFVSVLREVYELRLRMEGKTHVEGDGPPVRLIRLYELLTLFPGSEKEYSKADFARDLYLLDRSGTTHTRDRKVEIGLHPSTRAGETSLQIIGEDGRARDYFAASFRWSQ